MAQRLTDEEKAARAAEREAKKAAEKAAVEARFNARQNHYLAENGETIQGGQTFTTTADRVEALQASGVAVTLVDTETEDVEPEATSAGQESTETNPATETQE